MSQGPLDVITITPPRLPFKASPRLVGSKSITNRALPLAAVASGTSVLAGVLFAEDTLRMLEALEKLGLTLTVDRPGQRVTIAGLGGKIPNATAQLFCGNSGTTIRFLAAICAAAPGEYLLDGVERMRQRPIGELVDALRAVGAVVDYAGQPEFPPVRVGGGLAGGKCRFSASQSSQYISAILMAAPLARQPVAVELIGPVTSEPYVRMTLAMMEQFGVTCRTAPGADSSCGGRVIAIPNDRGYQARSFAIEPDASNASYFLAAAAISPGSQVTIRGLGRDSLQGDVLFADVLRQMGADMRMESNAITLCGCRNLTGLTVNMNAIPDMVQTLAVVALFAQGSTRIYNVGNLRIKETDRLAALEKELSKLGAIVTTTSDSITIEPPAKPRAARISTYDDHRMAMAFAVAGTRISGIEIENPVCVEKTYPDFFRDFQACITSRSS
ncbi:MAG: 3-phosphoshikimate 1-carboxyvinyltransferase [Phycisphaerae bacterium]